MSKYKTTQIEDFYIEFNPTDVRNRQNPVKFKTYNDLRNVYFFLQNADRKFPQAANIRQQSFVNNQPVRVGVRTYPGTELAIINESVSLAKWMTNPPKLWLDFFGYDLMELKVTNIKLPDLDDRNRFEPIEETNVDAILRSIIEFLENE